MLQSDVLAELERELSAVRSGAAGILDSLTEEQLAWRAEPNVWSVAQCFEHLRIFDRAYCNRMATALAAAPRLGPADRRWTTSVTGRLFLLALRPGGRLRFPAPAYMQPASVRPGEGAAVLRQFLEQQQEVLDLVRRASAQDVGAIRFPSPLSRLIRLTVADGLMIVVRHEERHLGQARRLARLAADAGDR